MQRRVANYSLCMAVEGDQVVLGNCDDNLFYLCDNQCDNIAIRFKCSITTPYKAPLNFRGHETDEEVRLSETIEQKKIITCSMMSCTEPTTLNSHNGKTEFSQICREVLSPLYSVKIMQRYGRQSAVGRVASEGHSV